MGRNAEVIRQWTILRELERARAAGATIDQLASLCRVSTRTIRRDLQALESAGFPLFDDRSADDGRTRWSINGQAFRGLTTGLTLSELCALYFSRTLLESLSGTPFRADLERAFDKLSAGLTPHMQRFLDQLPRVIATKADPQRRRPEDEEAMRRIVARAVEATLFHRQASFTYHSLSSERTKTYLVHPYRLAHAHGGMYLIAFVPEYDEVRTFAAERISGISLLEETFDPPDELPDQAFPHSLGVHSGPPEPIALLFAADVAAYVRAREWHRSQRLEPQPDGTLRMDLDVCRDQALAAWILSFGPAVTVLAPGDLAREVARAHRDAAARYAPA